jgi:hypothetical protein
MIQQLLTPGITRRPERLCYMTSGVSAVGCMPLLGGGDRKPISIKPPEFLLRPRPHVEKQRRVGINQPARRL